MLSNLYKCSITGKILFTLDMIRKRDVNIFNINYAKYFLFGLWQFVCLEYHNNKQKFISMQKM